MKNLIYFFAFVLAIFTFNSCAEGPVDTPEPTPTTGSLSFTIECDNGPVADAEIALSLDDPSSAEITYLTIQTTDVEGYTKFENLEPGEYFWYIKFKSSDEFVNLGLGSIEIEAGDRWGSPVSIGRDCD
jgi:hypothetical protein